MHVREWGIAPLYLACQDMEQVNDIIQKLTHTLWNTTDTISSKPLI